MAARILVLLSPLDASRRRRYELGAGTPLLEWVDANEPAVGRAQRVVYLNGHELTDRAYRCTDDDEILVTFTPAYAQIGSYILQAVIAAAISFAVSKIFAPKQPRAGSIPDPSQVYGLALPHNAARLGQPIPVVYGSVICVPDFAAQPSVQYVNNDQYLSALLCIGQGEHDVLELLLGNSSGASLPPEVATWRAFLPADHHSTFGVIEAATGVRENIVTLDTVGGEQELLPPNINQPITLSTWYWFDTNAQSTSTKPPIPPAYDLTHVTGPADALSRLPPNPALGTAVQALFADATTGAQPYITATLTAMPYSSSAPMGLFSLVPAPTYPPGSQAFIGPFESCKPGQRGSLIELDFAFPNGLFWVDTAGTVNGNGIYVQIEYTPIDDTGAAIGAPVLVVQYLDSTTPGKLQTTTPQRYTVGLTVPSGRYRVRVARQSAEMTRYQHEDRCLWAGYKFQLDPPPAGTAVYGNVTLVAIKLKATNGVSSDASGSIRFRVTRRLAPLALGATAATTNPADAFADIVTAPYGANRARNVDELDLDELARSRALWDGANGFNAVFDQPSTVWEALDLALQCVHAAPLPVGSRLSLVHDGVQPVRAQAFGDGNVSAGSVTVLDAFDTDGTPQGMRITYRDPRTFSTAALLVPAVAPDYVTTDLFGCTSAAVANEFATMLQNKRRLQRRSLTFQTELEGLSCLPGDRIGFQSAMMGWAQSALVSQAFGRTVVLDRPLVWAVGEVHAVVLRDPEGVPHELVGATPGDASTELVLPSDPPFPLVGYGESREPTLVAFGVAGSNITDWTVLKVTPQAGTLVQIDAVNYDPTVWAGAADYQQQPMLMEA